VQSPAATRPDPWSRINEASTLRTLNTFAVDLIGIPSVEELLWYVAQHVVGRLNFVDCVIYSANDAQTELQQVAAWGEKNPFGRNIINPLVIPFGRGITGQVARTQKAIIVDDLLKDENYIPDTQIARSEICVPLMFRGRVFGVIDSEHPLPNAFGTAEQEVLSTVAAMTAAKLELLAEVERSNRRYHDLMASHVQITQEITARKALEAKLFDARKLESLGRLTGRMAHALNNDLTVVLGNLEFLAADPTDPNAATFVADARTAADHGAQLMRDMLAFAQRTRLDPVVLDLNSLIVDLCAGLNSDRLSQQLQVGLWPILADRKALDSILSNLIENAHEATARSGAITVRTENLLHSLADIRSPAVGLSPGRYVVLTVTDSGTGIPPDRLSQIFDPFFTTKPMDAGRGLGLSIVRGFAQQSGGAVSVQSAPGEGSTFRVCLPAHFSHGNESLTISG
jgi:signal transduction histidine kinase